MKFIGLCMLCLMLASCGATVDIDYDKDVDFATYNTYNYFSSVESGLSELDDKRIFRITDSILQSRGFIKSESPQILINFFANEQISNSRNTLGIGVGSGGGNVGVGVSGGIPIGGRSINQRLTMDFIDAQEDKLVWQAQVDGDYKEKSTPLQRERYYQKVLLKAIDKYPPKSKK